MELLPSTSRWHPFVSVDPDRMGGEPVFRGTRVPVRILFEFLSNGQGLNEFLDEFEGVPREYAVALLSLLGSDLNAELSRGSGPDARAA